ncbi:Bug family tripartite tricarboxylate transporter substrate binding protein [Advenella mimigardefordensis]|uniref:Putative Bug-like extracytoplasmic solute binding receptor, TTT family n=1 Tax=Advenella mimigardefordensis (strain DSM 17166 / LMG 22922 / DPN7) TaxID=1247726 RepID=W0PFE0_ADVMD|nr:tripartite tricarboxylate transporter substrate binding protein [Advenella mimigardefordensis]AHG63773.1 putative Bug-like extracytoplasmic solute binding receptor, TTT family [Advenella mimigardefordensis DPN7]
MSISKILSTVLLGIMASQPVLAQSFNKPIRLVVPFGAGGATDVLARLIAPTISQQLKQPVIVENRPGANGQIGAQFVKSAPADGSILMVTTEHPVVILPFINTKAPYTGDDFTILGKIANLQWALSTSKKFGAQNLKEFVEHIRQHPADGNYGVPSDGGIPQMIGSVIAKTEKIEMEVIPYGGAGPMIPHLMGGQIGSGVTGLPEAISMLDSGKVDVLGIAGSKRSTHLPDVPTFKELGYEGLAVDSWFGVFSPKGINQEMKVAFHKALQLALENPEVKNRIYEMSIDTLPMSLEQADSDYEEAIEYWKKAYKK